MGSVRFDEFTRALTDATEAISRPSSSSTVLHQLPSSRASSSSEDDLVTDHGLQRALAGTAPPVRAPAVMTTKERKNIEYLDNMRRTHTEIRQELDEAIEEYQHVDELRDTNQDPALEAAINLQFLQANNRLAHASREYDSYIDDLSEVRRIPKFSKRAMQLRFASAESHQDLSRSDSTRETLKRHEADFLSAERDREDLIHKTNAIDALTEQVAYVEHLNEDLQNQLDFSQEFIHELGTHLQNANSQIRNYQTQMSHAYSKTTQLKDENVALWRNLSDLRYSVSAAEEHIMRLENVAENLRGSNKDLRRNNEFLRREFDEVQTQASALRRRCSDATSPGGVAVAAAAIKEPAPKDSAMVMDQILLDGVASIPPSVPKEKADSL